MSNPIFVPIDLDVLLANKALLARDTFRCWKYAYTNLSDDTFYSPEPFAFDDNYDTMKPGAYLHWTLPRSLRCSREGSTSQYPLVPNRWLVVRVYRDNTGHNLQKAWVIESDCPSDSPEGSGFFLVNSTVVNNWENSSEPNRKAASPAPISTAFDTGAYTVNLGKAFDQTAWKEQTEGNLFLTAIAPGNFEFSAYTPHNEGIFSFYDDLADAPDSTTLSYLVTGWYSDFTRDIMTTGTGGFTGGGDTAGVLRALSWTVAGNANPGVIDISIYSGMAFSLGWERNANDAPAPDQLQDTKATSNMTVSIANTSVDAFSTLVYTQLQSKGYPNAAQIIELLRAFHYDLLPLYNTINGDDLIWEKIRQEWFSSKRGGTQWTIVTNQPANGAMPDISASALTPAEQAWLLQLNQDQKALDDAMQELYSGQWDLNAVWWKYGYMNAVDQQMKPNKTGIDDPSDLLPFLDATNPDSLLSDVLGQLAVINGLQAKLPQPIPANGVNAQDAFLNGVTAFAAQKGIEAGKSLKAIAQPRFWKPNNPVVMISGIEPADITNPDNSLEVRIALQLISSFVVSGITVAGASLGNIIPLLSESASLPSGITGIYQEFFLLDPANAGQVAAAMDLDADTVKQVMATHDTATYNSGTLPSIDLVAWSQQWNPLYLEWEVTYAPIPFEWIDKPGAGKRTRYWSFDGTDYNLATNARSQGTHTLRGRSLLSPHTRFTFGDRLKAFVDQYGDTDTDLRDLYTAISGTDSWKFLGQELVNMGELLSQRDARVFRRPVTETCMENGMDILLSKVMGYTDTSRQPPYDTPSYGQGLVSSVPAVKIAGPSDFPFHGIRSGQCYFSHLILYDKFGRQLDLIAPGESGVHDANNFPLVRDAAFMVTNKLIPAVAAPFQLPPRLLQPARLDMLLVDQEDNSNVLGLAANVNPVCGWVIANHLDQSLLVYDPNGVAMGEIKLVQGISGDPLAAWTPPPHAAVTINDITGNAPQLGAFITATIGKTVPEFQALLGAIDSTLWTTDPLGSRTDQNLSVLIGRPLALLRIRLQCSLDGPARTSCDWPMPIQPAPTDPNIPDFTTSRFSIRLGDLASREDGVIGYFENDNYAVFNSVVTPMTGQQYVKEIGPLNGIDGNYINLPFDGQTTELITLLADPRASIHATTGILPVKELKIPAQFIDGPLAAMEITFRMGPLLSRLQTSPATGDTPPPFPLAISYLPVSEQNGAWSWWEDTVTNPGGEGAIHHWQGYDMNDPGTGAALSDNPATLREGYLQFVTNTENK